MKRISASIILTIALLSSAVMASAAEKSGPRSGWNPDTYKTIAQWLDSLKEKRAETLLVLFDCDNTSWAGDIADSVTKASVRNGIVTWKNAPMLADYPFDKTRADGTESTPFDYYEHLYDISPPLSYNYAAQMFAGLSLAEIDRAFRLAAREPDFPVPYAEIKELVKDLSTQGIDVGFSSASPIFLVAPMVERAGFNAPLRSIEGVDVYVRDQKATGEPVLLSNLIHSEGLTSWSEVLKRHGRMIVTSRTSEIMNARKGKAVSGFAIAARHVISWNASHRSAQINMNDMRLAGAFGDNFSPFADLQGSESHEAGNDQGLLRALPFIESGGLVLNVYKASEKDGSLDLEKKKPSNDRFLALVKQIAPLYSSNVFINQIGIYEGTLRGHFSTAPIPAERRPQCSIFASDPRAPIHPMNYRNPCSG